MFVSRDQIFGQNDAANPPRRTQTQEFFSLGAKIFLVVETCNMHKSVSSSACRSVLNQAANGKRWLTGGKKVFVAGQGMVPITRKQSASLRTMGAQAIESAVTQAGLSVGDKSIGALYVGNMMSGMLSKQQHMGPLLATAAG